MSRRTPGPWRFDPAPTWPKHGDTTRAGHIERHDASEGDPCVAYIESVGPADLALMLAAPELLDALKWAVEWMEQYEGETMPGWRVWQASARAAIAKAEGGAS